MEQQKPKFNIGTITHLTCYSTLITFGSLVVGEIIDLTIISLSVFPSQIAMILGGLLIILGTLLTVWTHSHGKDYSKGRKEHKLYVDDLSHGPYKFSRNPHHLGLGILVIGIAIFINSLALIATTVVSALIVHFFFIEKEEKILHERHGHSFDEYKSKTRKWL